MQTLFTEYEPIAQDLRIESVLARFQSLRTKPKERVRGITSQRQHVISLFVDEINKDRAKQKQPPLSKESVKNISIKLSILKTIEELYEYLAECKDYAQRSDHGNFSMRFYGGFKKNDI